MLVVRLETPADINAVRDVNRLAFGREAEGRLVDELRAAGETISLVADLDGRVVGHLLFSPVKIEDRKAAGQGEAGQAGAGQKEAGLEAAIPALALAPLAVRPEFQNRGIGSALVYAGLEQCRRLGHRLVIVLGHPDYYPRFGFIPARAQGIEPPFNAPDEAWMTLELQPGALAGVWGTVRYPPAFDGV